MDYARGMAAFASWRVAPTLAKIRAEYGGEGMAVSGIQKAARFRGRVVGEDSIGEERAHGHADGRS